MLPDRGWNTQGTVDYHGAACTAMKLSCIRFPPMVEPDNGLRTS